MNGVWYKDHGRYGNARLKDVDKKYVSSVTMADGEKVLATPIYAFGKMGNRYVPMFGVRLIAREFCTFVSKMVWDLERKVLLELWVDDKDIISAKRNCKNYKDGEDVDEIAYSDFRKYCLDNYTYDDIEVLLPCIRDYQLIAIRDFKYVNSENSTCKVKTTVVNKSLLPTFVGTLFVNGDGYLRELTGDRKLKVREDNYINIVQGQLGMQGVYTYMTVAEAHCCVCAVMWERIRDQLRNKGLQYKESLDMTIGELFDTSAFMLTV